MSIALLDVGIPAIPLSPSCRLISQSPLRSKIDPDLSMDFEGTIHPFYHRSYYHSVWRIGAIKI
jgi:hypothetical protein